MGFVRVQKAASYFKRFQVKPKRRREGKTDYKARRRLVTQDLNKFKTPKYRFVVRITNKDVICQVIYSLLVGDIVLAAAYAHELPRYGAKAGSTNYAACYATGLLCARRLLAKVGLADKYAGVTKLTGDDKPLAVNEDRRPFKAVLDIGLARTTTGARIFGALKGALDGGLDIPHSDRRFAGFKNGKLDANAHRARILGAHVAAYMKDMKEGDEEKYKAHFSHYIKAGLSHDGIEKMWTAVHAAIRKDPSAAKKKPRQEKPKQFHRPKMSTAARVHRRTQKKAALRKRAAEGDADE